MASRTYYDTGTVSVDNGGTTISGTDTGWGGGVIEAGDLFMDPAQPAIPPQRIASVTDDGAAELAYPWPGTDVVDGAYEVRFVGYNERSIAQTRRYLAQLGLISNTGIGIDGFGTFADRADYAAAAKSFAYLSTDGDGDTTTDPVVFLKLSAADEWSEPVGIAGPAGPQGVAGLIGVWRGPYSGVTAYDAKDVTREAGSAWIAKVPTTGNAPPTLPTTSNTWWELVSQKGDPGDVTGPGASVAGHVAVYADTSGALLADGGALGTAAALNAGTASGEVPVLDGSGKLDTSILPAIAITDVFTVASQAAMLALSAEKGDIAIRSDLNKCFALSTNSPGTLADWKELLTPIDTVLAVAGLTGSISAAALKAALAIAAGDVSGILAQGRMAMHIPASAMTPRVTNGAGISTYDSGSNDVTLTTLDFDASSQEFAHFEVIMPKSWDRGTVSAKFYWTNAAGTSTQVVRWSLAAVAISDDDPLNATRGTAATVDDTWLAQGDLHTSAETSAMTIAGSPAAEDLVVFEVSRVVSGVTGNMTGDAKLSGIALFINLNAATDA